MILEEAIQHLLHRGSVQVEVNGEVVEIRAWIEGETDRAVVDLEDLKLLLAL